MPRVDGRAPDELRPVSIQPGYLEFAEGSVLIEAGKTRVVCSASIDESVPRFLRGTGSGWITAEYAMLPRSTHSRTARDRGSGGGRTIEIQRLIGRSMRSVAELDKLGARTVTLDCDVLQADGGTRTLAITGAYLALYQALLALVRRKALHRVPLRAPVAATSVGLVGGELLLDLCYEEDSRAEADFNVVMAGTGELVEVQGTGEQRPFSREEMQRMLDLAETGIRALFEHQRQVVERLLGS